MLGWCFSGCLCCVFFLVWGIWCGKVVVGRYRVASFLGGGLNDEPVE